MQTMTMVYLCIETSVGSTLVKAKWRHPLEYKVQLGAVRTRTRASAWCLHSRSGLGTLATGIRVLAYGRRLSTMVGQPSR